MSVEEPIAVDGARGVLRGVRHRPDASVDCGVSAVLLQGYFTSTHIGPARLYVQIGRLLAAAGVELWRIDPHGVGDSDGDFADGSYASQLEDYRRVLDAAAQSQRRVMLVAHSLGASMALRLATELQQVERLWLLSPGCGPFSFRDHPFHERQRAELMSVGATERHATHITRDFVEAMSDEGIYAVARAVRAPVLVTWGTADELYDRANLNRLLDALRSADVELLVLDGADHNALVPGARARLLTALAARAESIFSRRRSPPSAG